MAVTEVSLQHSGYPHVFHAILPPWVTKMNVSTWVICKHMPMDQQPSVYSHITEQWHVKRSYDGIVADAPLCEKPRLWLDPTELETVSYCREPRAGEHRLQWCVGSRLICFEKDKKSLGETQPCICWVICDSVPVCVAIGRLRPCTPAELLAFHEKNKPIVPHLFQQTLRHNKISSMNATNLIFRRLLVRHA